MSSTVTTTTVATLTMASTFDQLGSALTLVTLVLLVIALLGREITSSANGALGKRVGRGLDLAITPLLVAFGLMLTINSGTLGA